MERSNIQTINEKEFGSFDSRLLLIKPADLSPYLVYSILRDWFGEAFTEEDEAKIQWQYFLVTPHLRLHVYDWKLDGTSIGVYAREDEPYDKFKEEAEEFVNLLHKQIPKYAGKIKSTTQSAYGFNFQNPYAMYFASAERLLSIASEIQKDHPLRYDAPSDLYKAAFFLYVASFEGLLNLIYEIYLNPALRDERIYSRLQREQVDVKVRLAPVYCSCFKVKSVDAKTEKFQRFQFVVELRNDFIHANITRPMRSSMVEKDGFVFRVDQEQIGKYGLPRNPAALDKSHLEFVRETIQNMVRIILEAMTPRYRREFSLVIEDEIIGVDIVEDEFVIVH
jgi:hypothetical protein